jgi:methionine synthase II (cobalamin-independent)
VDVDDEAGARAVQVTGVGSMPGTDPVEAARIVAGELDLPHLPELPARGPGADMVGRTLALVAATTGEFSAETTPTGWRLAGGRAGAEPGRSMRRGSAWLAEDGDRLEEALAGFTGTVKVQVAGPWTLAAGLEAPRGTRVLADEGACAELSHALGEALAAHVAGMRQRVPGAAVVAQLDEPSLPAVLAGRIRTASGRGALRTPGPAEVAAALVRVREAAEAGGAADVLVHCCAREVPFDVLARAGISTLSVDLAAVGRPADEQLGAWWDRGGRLVLGVVPVTDPTDAELRAMPESVVRSVDALWRRIGFGVAEVGERTWLSPACGLAGASPSWARRYGALLRRAAGMLQSA